MELLDSHKVWVTEGSLPFVFNPPMSKDAQCLKYIAMRRYIQVTTEISEPFSAWINCHSYVKYCVTQVKH